jgi:hypothetical protein
VKFSERMRANGVSDFPDPNASGEFPSYGVSVSPAVWKNAGAACKALQPPGTLSAKLTPAQESAALKWRLTMVPRRDEGNGVLIATRLEQTDETE